MNQATAQRIKKNPFYKMTDEQRREAEEADKKPMVEFGIVDRHNQSVPLHSVRVERVARKN